MAWKKQTKRSDPYKEQVLRARYFDVSKVIEYLNEVYGKDRWQLRERRDRWVVMAREALTEAQLDELEKRAYEHY